MAGPTATFQADFRKWDSEFARVKRDLKSFEVPVGNVQQALKRMVDGFSGAKIQREAQIAVAAVEKIGGVTKLTDSEQRKLNATVTEAIAKYKALGLTAPASLTRIEKETRQAEVATKGIGTSLGSLKGVLAGAFAGLAIGSVVKDVIALGGELSDLSARTGIGVKALQEFKFAGAQVGVSLDSISTAVGQMQKRVAGGDASAVAAMRKLGLSVAEFRSLRPEDQFQAVADKIQAIEDPAARAKLAMDIMGKGALEVMPLLVGGLAELRAEAERLGVVLDEETVSNLDALGDSMDALKLAGQAAIANALVPMVPLLKDLASAGIEAAKWIGSLGNILSDAQLAFQSGLGALAGWIVSLDEAGIAVLKLQRTLNPLSNISGNVDRAIAELTEEADRMRYIAKSLSDDVLVQLIKRQAEYTSKTQSSVAAIVDVTKATKDQKDAIADLRDQLSGQGALKALKDLEQAWKTLTPAQRANRDVIESVIQAYNKVRPALREHSGVLEDLRRDYQAVIPQTDTFAHLLYALSTAVPDANRTLQEAATRVRNLTQEVIPSTRAIEDFMVAARAVPQVLSGVNVQAVLTAKTLGEEIGDNLVKGFEEALEAIPDIIVQGVLHGASAEDIAVAIGTKVGASVGKAIGTAVGGELGGAIGEAVGSLLGPLIDKMWTTDAERAAKELGREWGVSISESLSKEIEKTMKTTFAGMRNNRWAAEVLHLGDIIDEAGLSAQNFNALLGQMRQSFVFLEEGTFSSAQAVQVLDESFGKFVDFLGGNVTPALKEIIHLNDQFGLHSKAIAEYVDNEARTALGALGDIINSRGEIAGALAEAQRKLDDLKKHHAGSDEIKKATAEVAKLQAQLAALPLTGEGAQALGASLFGIFERLTRDGAPALEVIKEIDPIIESLDQQLQQAGLSGGAAFDQIKALAGLATDEIAGPALEAVSSYGAALQALNNADILTPETFKGIADQVGATVTQLESQGKTAKEIYPFIAGSLQTIWELQQDYGYAVDENTQKLLDQAEADGVVGDTHRSVQEQMLLALQDVRDVIVGLGELFGVTLPQQAQDGATGIQEALDGIDAPDLHIKVRYDDPGFTPQPGSAGRQTPGYAGGTPGLGFVDFGKESLVRLHGREAVIPAEMASRAAQQWGGGSSGSSYGPTVVVLEVDGRALARAVIPTVPPEARRLGVRVRT